MAPTAVVALGGHAILPKHEWPTVAKQFRYARRAMREVLKVTRQGYGLAITHGNGPQVGHILIRSEIAAGRAYTIPLSVAVAESEGEIGYIIVQSLYNEMAAAGLTVPVVTLVTLVRVDPEDPAFETPTKPIGPFYTEEQAEGLLRSRLVVRKVEGGMYRRVVASPRPIEVLEAATIRRLVEDGVIAVAAGGGGIPVYRQGRRLKGVDAVIDKDLASSCLAQSIKAELLLILTDVPRVSLGFGTPKQRDLPRMTPDLARRYLGEGHFPPGSMGPKVEAAVEFVERTGRRALITSPESLQEALAGGRGTWIEG